MMKRMSAAHVAQMADMCASAVVRNVLNAVLANDVKKIAEIDQVEYLTRRCPFCESTSCTRVTEWHCCK